MVVPVLVRLRMRLGSSVAGFLVFRFEVWASLLAVAGLVTLGFLAMARLTGSSVGPGRGGRGSAGGSARRGLVVGIVRRELLWIAFFARISR